MPIFNEKCHGAFWGLPIGDALGAPVEFARRGSFQPVTDMMSGGYFQLPAGAWTDDTAMAICLAESLIARPSLDPQDLMERFRGWIERQENTSTGKTIGVGQNTLRVLCHHIRTGEVFAPETRQKSDGNGAIMRLSPVACLHWQNPEEARRIARLQSLVTHYSEKSAAACELLAEILCKLIAGTAWNEAIAIQPYSNWPDEIQEITLGTWRNKTEPEIQSTGYVVHTLEAALWSVENSSSFSEAVLNAVNLGDDADSVAAVAGQLAGARYGFSEIPSRWLNILAKKEHIESIANRLYVNAFEAA